MGYPQNFISLTYTFSDDNAHQPVTAAMWFKDVNIHIETNDIYYGDRVSQDATANSGDVLTYENLELSSFFAKNKVAGSNAELIIVGTLMTPKQIAEIEAG